MARERSPAFFLALQHSLLVLPLLLLIGLGLYFVRQDKHIVIREARERAEQIAQEALSSFIQARTNIDFALYLNPTNPWPGDTLFFQVTTNFELVFPPPIQLASSIPSPAASLLPPQSNLWAQAEQAEFQSNDFSAALRSWDALLASTLPAEPAAVARFNRAVLLAKASPSNVAPELQSLTKLPVGIRAESGHPLAHLAGLKLVLLAGNPDLGLNPNELSDAVASDLVRRPTEFNEGLFALPLGEEKPLKDRCESLYEAWRLHELARSLHADAVKNRNIPAQNFETLLAGQPWSVFIVSETNAIAYSPGNLISLAESITKRAALPPYLHLRLFQFNRDLSRDLSRDQPPFFASQSESDPALRCEVHLVNPTALFARQRQRALWLTALIAAAALIAGIGIVHTHRSFSKQQRLNALKSDFVASVSHELRSPLASMRLMSEGLQSGRVLDPEKQREYFNYLVQECRRLSVLVENVLDFSRIEQNRKIYNFEEVDARSIAESCRKTIAPVAAERQVALELLAEPADGPFVITADSVALQQAILNLLDNAIKHSPLGAKVTLSLGLTGDHLEITVTDRGPGIPASEHQRIFERFYRLGSELRRETPGVGIGLSIVKHIVEAHRGSIQVESSPGDGATFSIRLPRKQP